MADAPISVDRAKCTGCGKCVKGCGFGALALVDAPGANKLGRVAAVDAAACRACSACVKACPFGAISEVRVASAAGTADLGGWRDVWVFAERTNGKIADVAFELLAKGRELKAQRGDGCRLAAVLLGSGLGASETDALARAGADVVYVVDDPALADYEACAYADAVARLAEKHRPETFLAGATAIGRAFFARVATRLRTGLTADCTALKIESTENKATGAMQMLLHQTRPAFGGNIMATIMTPNHRPQMATVRPKVFKRAADAEVASGAGEIVREVFANLKPRTRLAGVRRDPDAVDVAACEVLVAGGRGLKKPENFALLAQLAERLGGEVAASRAAVDAGWAPASRQVGQTGKTVAPKLYLCFGISGAIQHLEGIRGADRIIAVNVDPNAPIFGVADYGVVGDALEILPALIRAFDSANRQKGTPE